MTHRPIAEIAVEIKKCWPRVNYAAVPYLNAMKTLTDKNSNYYCDSATSIVTYFLGNASTWRGDDAKRIKAELKALIA